MAELVNNKEVVRMEQAINKLLPYFWLCGLGDPKRDLQPFNIRYSVTGVDTKLGKAHSRVETAAENLRKIRSTVLHDWGGDAADEFERYASDVLDVLDEMSDRISAQQETISEVLAEIKKIVRDINRQVMDTAQVVATLVTLPMGGIGGMQIGGDRLLSGDSSVPNLSAITDTLSLLLGVINDGMTRIMNLRNMVDGSEEGLGALKQLKTPDGRSIAGLELHKEKKWAIDASDKDVYSGFEPDTVDDPDQWVRK